MSTIPASGIVNVKPSVLAAGGSGVNGTGLILTTNPRVPIGTVQAFSNEAAVSAYFGASSALTTEAGIYFDGFNNSSILPASLLFAQYNGTAVAAFMRGGNISSLSLAQLQAINGTLDILIDGIAHNGTANLSSATSFSNAASLIQAAINGTLVQQASVTGTIAPETFSATGSISGAVMTVTNVANGTVVPGAALSGTGVPAGTTVANQISGTPGGPGTYGVLVNGVQTLVNTPSTTINGTYGLMTVSAVGSGVLAVGDTVAGSGVTAGTIISALGSGVGGTGTYFVSPTQTVGSVNITATGTPATVAFDSVSGAFVVTSGIQGAASTIAFATGGAAAALLLTSATGAVLSQGANGVTPAAFMTALIVQNSAWVNFMTHFDPDGGNGNAQKQAFSAWKNTQNNRFGYFCWDPDASPAASSNAAGSLGQIFKGNGDSGTLLIWEGGATIDNGLCAFALGWAASINYQQTNGRAALAFKAQPGLVANVTDPTTADNLLANGYNFYGAYGSANLSFIWFQTGQITGPFAWADSFQTQVWLNTFFQQQFLTMLQNVLSVPFSTAGAALIEAAALTVIAAGLNFDAFGPDTLDAEQIAEVNEAAGTNIATTLQNQGYYLQVIIPGAVVRAARGPWPITFWYIDQGAVQSIDLSSVLVQ